MSVISAKRVTRKTTANSKVVVIGYARVSTLEQVNNTSLTEQERQIKAFCKLNGYELAELITEQGSGRKSDRTGFQELMHKLDTNSFDGVVCTKVDRLYRGIVAMGELFRKLDQKDKFIHTIDGVNTTQPQGRLLASMLGSFGELEADMIKQRMRSGRMANAEQHGKAGGANKGITGIATFGYLYVDGELIADSDKLDKVKQCFRLFADGWSIGVVARWLSQHYKTPRGNNFSPQTVRKMLKNVFYIGQYKYGNKQDYVVDKKHHTPAIPRKLWNDTQTRLQGGYRYKRLETAYLENVLDCLSCE